MGRLSQYRVRVRNFFKDQYGQPFDLTDGQEEIYRCIFEPSIRRATIKAVTQYGKSDVASMALIDACAQRYEKVIIVAPSIKQSKIIMTYTIKHLFDNPIFATMIEYKGSLERLKQERSKQRITFKNESEIMILTANVRTISEEAKSIMGFGATMLLEDEASLVPDTMQSKILRMVGGARDGRLIKLGNPFERNHFFRSFYSPRYKAITVDYQQAIKEGRLSQEFVDEARDDMSEMDFKIFYECVFPELGAEDALVPYSWMTLAVDNDLPAGEKIQSGLDVARFGRDKTVYVKRKGGRVVMIEKTEEMDTMRVVGWVQQFIENGEDIAVDVIGIGAGVYDRLDEIAEQNRGKADKLQFKPHEVNVAETANENDRFFNKRAELYWHLRKQFKPETGQPNISIPNDAELKKELPELRYKYSSEKKIRIESKEEMKKRLGHSPDTADALMLAFADLTLDEPKMYIG